MVDKDDYAGTEYDQQATGTPPEARTPKTGPHAAATAYAEQGNKGKGTQDPFPYDPTNELLDGDDHPSADDLAAKGLRISDSGRAVVRDDDPSGYELIPPPHSNLELDKWVEKHAVSRDVSAGLDPEVGRKARVDARKAAKKVAAEAREHSAGQTADEKAQARQQAPQGRSSTPSAPTKATGGKA